MTLPGRNAPRRFTRVSIAVGVVSVFDVVEDDSVVVFHAGVVKKGGRLINQAGRVVSGPEPPRYSLAPPSQLSCFSRLTRWARSMPSRPGHSWARFTIAGFSALLFSGLPGLVQLGVYAITGLVVFLPIGYCLCMLMGRLRAQSQALQLANAQLRRHAWIVGMADERLGVAHQPRPDFAACARQLHQNSSRPCVFSQRSAARNSGHTASTSLQKRGPWFGCGMCISSWTST